MKNLPLNQHPFKTLPFDNVSLVIDIFSKSQSKTNAIGEFADLLNSQGFDLLYYATYDADARRKPRIFYSVIEALNSKYYDEDFNICKHYLLDLQGLEYDEISIVPVEVANVIHVFVVGLDWTRFQTFFKSRLTSIIGQFVVSLDVRFSNQAGRRHLINLQTGDFGKQQISAKEIQCLKLCLRGKTSYEIAQKLRRSENSVDDLIKVACDKLEAENLTDAVSKALSLGLIQLQ